MKRIILYVITLLMLPGLWSCENWLDVDPKSEIKADKLFETETGFKDALAGLYIGMTHKDVYGRNLSWREIEYMAGQYQRSNNSFTELQKYNYAHETAQKFIEAVWAKEYNIIAEANLLLESLEQNGQVLNPTVFNVVKGEALAIRALCHFDLIRLFAKGNLANRKELLTEPCIPYVTAYSKVITEQKSYARTLELLHQDIDAALECLKSDPLYPYEIERPDDYEDVTEDVLFTGTRYKGRETHLSWPAVLLLKARVNLWEGNEPLALENAEDVISAYEQYIVSGEKNWATETSDVSSGDEKFRDYVFRGELLFALDGQKLEEYIEGAYEENTSGSTNNDRLFQPKAFVEEMFNTELTTSSDLRLNKQWEKVTWGQEEGYLTVKIRKTQGTRNYNFIPLMRISEAYLIAAECLKSTDRSLAVGYLNQLKVKRNIVTAEFLPETISEEELQKEIIRDYRREFSQEGQLFFCYKRLGLQTFAGMQYLGSEMTDGQYQLPYPNIENELGQRK